MKDTNEELYQICVKEVGGDIRAAYVLCYIMSYHVEDKFKKHVMERIGYYELKDLCGESINNDDFSRILMRVASMGFIVIHSKGEQLHPYITITPKGDKVYFKYRDRGKYAK